MRTLAFIVALAITGAAAQARADRGKARHERHLRVRSRHGPIHVWLPAGYDSASAATVVYVHGYFTHVDHAWFSYHLAAQFRASRLNAMFISCEAPASDDEPVAWSSLAELLEVVAHAAGARPEGKLVAIGHSGAHRTISRWLDEPRLDTIALVDAAYGDLSSYATWLEARPERRLIDVGDLTRPAADAFHDALPDTVVVEHFPPPEHGTLPLAALDARVIYVRSDMGHMALVTGGVAIPMILRALDAPMIGDTDRDEPLVPYRRRRVPAKRDRHRRPAIEARGAGAAAA